MPDTRTDNPLVQRYQEWAAHTPLVTRSASVLIFGFSLASFVFGVGPSAAANIPVRVIFGLEIYRLVLSPWFEPGVLSLLFVWLSFQGIGSRLEAAFGSTGFLIAMSTLILVSNMLFVLTCIVLEITMISPGAMHEYSSGFWVVILGLIVLECSISPDTSRRLFLINVEIPTKYYPWALLGLFSLFFGISLAHGQLLLHQLLCDQFFLTHFALLFCSTWRVRGLSLHKWPPGCNQARERPHQPAREQ